MTSIRLGEGALLSNLLEDQSSLDDVGSVDYFLSLFRNSMLLCSFGAGFPPNLFPIWGFLFVSSSAILFPEFHFGTIVSVPFVRPYRTLDAGVRLAVQYLKNVNMDLILLRICIQSNGLIARVCTVHRSVGLAQMRVCCFLLTRVVSLHFVIRLYVVFRFLFFHMWFRAFCSNVLDLFLSLLDFAFRFSCCILFSANKNLVLTPALLGLEDVLVCLWNSAFVSSCRF